MEVWTWGAFAFFIGHRDVPDSVLPMLSQAVEQHIVEYGVTDFLWDTMDGLMRWRHRL